FVAPDRREGGEREGEDLGDVERSRLVLTVEAFVLAREAFRIDLAGGNQEARPLVVAVDGQQRVVEIEEGEIHDRWAILSARAAIARREGGLGLEFPQQLPAQGPLALESVAVERIEQRDEAADVAV